MSIIHHHLYRYRIDRIWNLINYLIAVCFCSILESIGSELDLNRCQMMILRDHLGGWKPFSITEIANRYGVSYQTARNHVNGLLRMGLVHAHSKNGKTVLYMVSDDTKA